MAKMHPYEILNHLLSKALLRHLRILTNFRQQLPTTETPWTIRLVQPNLHSLRHDSTRSDRTQ